MIMTIIIYVGTVPNSYEHRVLIQLRTIEMCRDTLYIHDKLCKILVIMVR